MARKALFFLVSALAVASFVSAQAAPNWTQVPDACASACSQTVEVSYLCENQYSSDITDINGCFCDAFPSDADACATCLNSNNAGALASLLTSDETACPQAITGCLVQCSFATCDSSDINCQCAASYLESIYQCASCNTANGNAGKTNLTDFQTLDASCEAQNYTGATQSFSTEPLPSPTGEDAYVAPSLTATGDSGSSASASGAGSSTSAAAASSAASSAKATSATSSKAASSATTSSAKASSASAAASSSSKSGAGGLVAPALGGILAVAGAIAALL